MTATTLAGIPRQLGHVALRVRDVDRAVQFYVDVVGLRLCHRGRGAAFLGAREDASHELALFPLPDGAAGPDPTQVGMYHMAWEMASFAELEQLHERLLAGGARVVGYSDNQSNVMFLDPDGNELEAFWEPPNEERAAAGGAGEIPRQRLRH